MARPCIPCFTLGLGQTPLPALGQDEAIELVRITLRDVATRPSCRGYHQEYPLQSPHICYTGGDDLLRGSDLSERVCASVKLLKHAKLTERRSCLEVADILGAKLGSSRRGRPRRCKRERDLLDNAETVRSLYRKFESRICAKRGVGWANAIVEKWFLYALGILGTETGQGPLLPKHWQPSGFFVSKQDDSTAP